MCNQKCQHQQEEGPTKVWEDAEYRATLLAGDDANVVIESRGDTDAMGVQVWEYEESVPFGTSVQNVLLGMSEEINHLRETVAELQAQVDAYAESRGVLQKLAQAKSLDELDPLAKSLGVVMPDRTIADLAGGLQPSRVAVDPAQVRNTTQVLADDDSAPAKEDPIAVLYDVWCSVVLPHNVVSRVFDLIKDRRHDFAAASRGSH